MSSSNTNNVTNRPVPIHRSRNRQDMPHPSFGTQQTLSPPHYHQQPPAYHYYSHDNQSNHYGILQCSNEITAQHETATPDHELLARLKREVDDQAVALRAQNEAENELRFQHTDPQVAEQRGQLARLDAARWAEIDYQREMETRRREREAWSAGMAHRLAAVDEALARLGRESAGEQSRVEVRGLGMPPHDELDGVQMQLRARRAKLEQGEQGALHPAVATPPPKQDDNHENFQMQLRARLAVLEQKNCAVGSAVATPRTGIVEVRATFAQRFAAGMVRASEELLCLLMALFLALGCKYVWVFMYAFLDWEEAVR